MSKDSQTTTGLYEKVKLLEEKIQKALLDFEEENDCSIESVDVDTRAFADYKCSIMTGEDVE